MSVALVLAVSHAPFYAAGGLLAVWAVVVSAIGISRPEFPAGRGAQMIVLAIGAVLVVGAASTAVLVAG